MTIWLWGSNFPHWTIYSVLKSYNLSSSYIYFKVLRRQILEFNFMYNVDISAKYYDRESKCLNQKNLNNQSLQLSNIPTTKLINTISRIKSVSSWNQLVLTLQSGLLADPTGGRAFGPNSRPKSTEFTLRTQVVLSSSLTSSKTGVIHTPLRHTSFYYFVF